MLALDHKKTPDFYAVSHKDKWGLDEQQTLEAMEKSALKPTSTPIAQKHPNKAELLAKCLKENGSGILSLNHPIIKGHVVVLDESHSR